MNTAPTGFCRCCASVVPLVRDEHVGESVCRLCRSYDITRTIRMTPDEWRIQRLHEMADAFESAFEVQS